MFDGLRRNVGWVALFSLIPLLHFPRALFADRTLFIRDIGMVWAPQVEAVLEQVARGDFPWFDARRGFGQPLFADPRAEVLYPPAWIHWVLPPGRSYAIFCAFHLILGAIGAARLARALIPQATMSSQAVAGFAFAAGGPMLSLVSHWHHLAAAAWMPWIVAAAEPQPERRGGIAPLPCLVALQVFAGSPDYSFATFLVCGLRGVTRKDVPWTGRLKPALGFGLGLLLSSVQLLPSLAFSADAGRERLPIGWALSPLHPLLTLETIVPIRTDTWPLTSSARTELFENRQVWMFSHYLGLSVWALACFGLRWADPSLRRFLVGTAALGLFLAWGVKSPALQQWISVVPLVSGLRFPTKHLVESSLGLSLLAAWGVCAVDRWTRRERGWVVGLSALSVAGCGAVFAWGAEPSAPFLFAPLVPIVSAALCMGIVVGMRRSSRALLPTLVALDLLIGSSAINPTIPGFFFRDRPPLTQVLPRESRLYVSDYSIPLRQGTNRTPSGPAYALDRVPDAFTQPQALALAAAWYLNPPMAGRFGFYGSFDLDILDFYRAPLKRTVEAFVSSRDSAFITDSLRRGSVDYVVTMDPPDLWKTLPLVHQEAPFFAAPVSVYKVLNTWPRVRHEDEAGERVEGAVKVSAMSGSRVRVESATDRASQLVLAFSNDRGWQASVDGEKSVIRDSAMAFVSVTLSKGQHVVEFRYEPPFLRRGLALSMLAAIALALNQHRRRALVATIAERPRAASQNPTQIAVRAVMETPTTADRGRNRNSTR